MKYGSSGFRDDAKKIINISFKIGVIVAYLTVTENDHFGIMITASHNKYLDNGVKIVDRNGNMIKRDYEIILEKYIILYIFRLLLLIFNINKLRCY